MFKRILLFTGLGTLAGSAAVLVFTDISAGTLRWACRSILLVGSTTGLALAGLRRIYGGSIAKKILGVLALIIFSTTLSLVAAEFSLRFFYHDISTTADGSSYFAGRWRHSQATQINRRGFREREFNDQKERGIYRIAVVGDSFTYGQGITEKDRLTNLLEDRLNRPGRRYEVLNFGRAGTETIDHVEILQQDVLPTAPDFILLQWFINDPEGHDYAGRPRQRPLIGFIPLDVWLHRNSVLYFLINEQWKKLQKKLGRVRSYEDYMTRRFRDPNSPDSRAARAALLDFFHQARQKDIPLGMVLFPQLVDVKGSPENYPLGFLMDRVKQTCRRENVSCLDLRPVLASISPARRLWVNEFDSHPGRLANEMATAAVYRYFKSTWQNGQRP